jgi:hypothetical protein
MNHLIKRLPIEIINIIITYTYKPQSNKLQKDIISYFQTKDIIYNIFYKRYNMLLSLNKNIIFLNFMFHIACYIKGTLKNFFRRTFMLHNSSNSIILNYENNMYKNTPNSRFRFYWSLLMPEERDKFIDMQKK